MNWPPDQVDVAEVGVDASGRLYVVPTIPAETGFDFIYRAGMEVSWEADSRSLVSPIPRKWSRADWFRQILSAVKGEYGTSLRVLPSTQWSNVPAEDRKEIEAWLKQA